MPEAANGGDLTPWPWRSEAAPKGGTPMGPETPFPLATPTTVAGSGTHRSLGRANLYKAFRLGGAQVAVVAEGTLPNANDRADLVQMPWRIHPPQFALFFVHSQVSLPATRPFRAVEVFGYPDGHSVLTVRDADGRHTIPVEDAVEDRIFGVRPSPSDGSGRVGVGYSKESLQDAFDAAVHQLPPPAGGVADPVVTYAIKRSGKVEGGIAGLELYFAEVEASAS